MKTQQNRFSPTFYLALSKSAMIREMAIEDGWSGLDQCLKAAPEELSVLARHADAAMRAMKQCDDYERAAAQAEADAEQELAELRL